jgi:hypothetical protein
LELEDGRGLQNQSKVWISLFKAGLDQAGPTTEEERQASRWIDGSRLTEAGEAPQMTPRLVHDAGRCCIGHAPDGVERCGARPGHACEPLLQYWFLSLLAATRARANRLWRQALRRLVCILPRRGVLFVLLMCFSMCRLAVANCDSSPLQRTDTELKLARLRGGAVARMPNFHGQRRAMPSAPPSDLASAVAAIIGLDRKPAAAEAGSAATRGARARGRGGSRARSTTLVRGCARETGGGKRGSKRGTAISAAGMVTNHESESSPAKKGRQVERAASVAQPGVAEGTKQDAFSARRAPEQADTDQDSQSAQSSIEVEVSARNQHSSIWSERAREELLEGDKQGCVQHLVASAAQSFQRDHAGMEGGR